MLEDGNCFRISNTSSLRSLGEIKRCVSDCCRLTPRVGAAQNRARRNLERDKQSCYSQRLRLPVFKQEERKTNRRVSMASAQLRRACAGWGSWGSVSLPICSSPAGVCRLQKLQKDIATAERTEDHHLQVLVESEALLQARRAELDKLKSQVWMAVATSETSSCCWEASIHVALITMPMCLIVEKTGKCVVKYKWSYTSWRIRSEPNPDLNLSSIWYLIEWVSLKTWSEIIYAKCVYKYLCLNF